MTRMQCDAGNGLLIEDALILSHLDEENGVRESLAIEGGRIVGKGEKAVLRDRFPEAMRISLSEHIVTPGLINSHTHASMSFFRGLGQAQVSQNKQAESSMIEDFFFPAEKALSPEMIGPLSYPYLVDALKSGCTSIVDAYFFIDGVAKALERLGMRGFIGEHIADLGGPHPAGDSVWRQFRGKIEAWPYSSRIQPVVYAHATDTVSMGLLRELASYSRHANLPFHMHLSQTQGERERTIQRSGKTPVQYAQEAGAIHSRSLLVHLVSADKNDLQIIKDADAVACLCPISEIIYEKLPNIEAIFDLGLRVALGTDCAASQDSADILQEAKTLAIIARHKGFLLSAKDLGAMVHEQAAKVFAPNDLGGLEVGKLADLVVIKNALELQPNSRPLTNLFFSAAHRQVQHVMVDGKWVLWNRELVSVTESELKAELERALLLLQRGITS